MSNELTDVRCPCGAEFQADSYDAGFIAGSGMCQNCDAALPPKDICTCPSGDGSLVHPCPAHPAVEQAGANVGHGHVFPRADGVKMRCGGPGLCSECAADAYRARAALAHRAPEVCSECSDTGKVYDESGDGPWSCYACTGNPEVIGYANGDELDNMLDDRTAVLSPGKTSFHTVPVYRLIRAALAQPSPMRCLACGGYHGNSGLPCPNMRVTAQAQPSPAQAEQHWPKLEKPAQVGAIRFRAGLSSRLVVEAAQRLYEFESTPEKEAERIERLQAFREQCFEPLGAEFSKVLSENLVELSSDAKPEQADEKPGDSILCYGCFAKGVGPDHFDEAGKCLAAQAEAERPEVAEVAFVLRNIGAMDAEDIGGDNVDLRFEDAEGRDTGCDVSIVEYAEKAADLFEQHDRIVGALRAKIAQLRQHKNDYMDAGQETYRALQNEIREREAEIARLDGLVSGRTAERDAALARVAEMERQEPVVRAYGVLPPFAEKVLAKLRRFYDCAEDFESGGVDIGRYWLDLLTQLGLLNRVQRSPALWDISQQGEDLLEAPVAQAQHSVPEASEQEKEQGWTLDYRFVERVTELAASRTEYTTSMEATEQVLLAARELLAAAPAQGGE